VFVLYFLVGLVAIKQLVEAMRGMPAFTVVVVEGKEYLRNLSARLGQEDIHRAVHAVSQKGECPGMWDALVIRHSEC
jgi:hypothetical protein